MSQTPTGPQETNLDDAGVMRSDYFPAPGFNVDSGDPGQFLFDSGGNLATRGAVTTDEYSFRDDFTGSSLSASMTGTATFTNGSYTVTGSGTLFLTEISTESCIKPTAGASDTFQRVSRVISDTELELRTAFAGSTTSQAPVRSNWNQTVGSGGAITVSGSYVSIAPGPTSGSRTQISRDVDYLPLISTIMCDFNLRQSSQEAYFGYQDAALSPGARVQVVFDGTDPTKAKFVTSSSSSASDTQTTTFTLPAQTSTRSRWRIELQNEIASVYFGDTVMAQHKDHLPGPYAVMQFVAGADNSAGVGDGAILHIDLITAFNTDVLQVAGNFQGAPMTVNAQSLLDAALNQMNIVLQQLRAAATFPDAAGRQRILLDSISAGVTLPTVTTVTTVTTVSTVTTVTTVGSVTNIAQVGGLLANGDQVGQWNNIALWNRGQIVVS